MKYQETDEVVRSKHFHYQLGTCGVDRTFDIYLTSMGKVVAILPFWEAFHETRFDTLLFMAAMDQFIDRGGLFFTDAITKLVEEDCYQEAS